MFIFTVYVLNTWVGAPFALIAASMRRGMAVISFGAFPLHGMVSVARLGGFPIKMVLINLD